MPSPSQIDLNSFMSGLEKRNPGEPEFQQAVREVAESILPFVADHPEYQKAHVFERMTEPATSGSTAGRASSSTTPSALTRVGCASIPR